MEAFLDCRFAREFLPRLLWALLVCLALSACSAPQSNTAMELMRHQQEQQAMMRMADARMVRDNTPGETERMLNAVREARNSRRYFAVLAYSKEYIAYHGHVPELDAMYAEALMETGQIGQSRAIYRSLLRSPLSAQAHHGLGLLAARAGENAEAIRELSQAVALDPANATYLGDLGYARLRIGDLEGAGLALGQAAELAPEDVRALSNMAVLLLLRDQPRHADALMRDASFSVQARERVYAVTAELRRQPLVSAGSLEHQRLVR